jgi:predicted alpha-1,2-mannosidase
MVAMRGVLAVLAAVAVLAGELAVASPGPASIAMTVGHGQPSRATGRLLTGRDLVRLADPFVGTDTSLADQGTGGSAGNMSPAATAPFGMLSFGPRTSPDAVAFGAGYTYSDHRIAGFDLTRFQGGGCTGFGDVPLIPTTSAVTSSPARPVSASLDPRLLASFDHREEAASPGRYSVVLNPGTSHRIAVDLAAATRSGVGRFRFGGSAKEGSLVINAGGSANPDDASGVVIDPARREVAVTVTTGRFCEQPTMYRLHVVLQFSRAFASYGVWQRQSFREGGRRAASRALFPLGYQPGSGLPPTLPANPSGTAQAGAVVRFGLDPRRSVAVRVGLSYVSDRDARLNLRHEVGRRDVLAVAHRTSQRWAALLGRLRVSGGTATDRRMLATTLYQSMLSPQVVSDVNGRYPALDGEVHHARGWTAYSQMSLWDEYRAHAQLLAMLAPRQARDMARSLLADERVAGFLPRWPVVGGSPDIMVGDPALPFLADLAAFGVPGFSRRAAVAAGVRGAASNGVDDERAGALPAAGDPATLGGGYYAERPGNRAYNLLHFVPAELDASTSTTGGIEFLASPDLVWGSASTSLEYATADFATSRLAAATCQAGLARRFAARAAWWRHDFDRSTGYVEPRSAAGGFLRTGGTGPGHGFVEGDGSQYTFMVPFDVAGLRRAIGGRRALVRRLDELFQQLNAGPDSPHAFLGNEPGLATPYEYLWAGRPDRTESVIRRALRRLYAPTPDGYPGNVDGGTMSAWWALNAIGLFPPIPGADVLAVGAPLFDRVVLSTPGHRRVDIRAPGAGRSRRFVTGVRLGRHPLSRTWVRYSVLRRAHVLTIRTATHPGAWARRPGAAPPSYGASPRLRCGR